MCKEQKYGENDINDHTKECINKRDAKRKENDTKDAERKKENPKYTNVYMYLMDETPDIIEKITEQKKAKVPIKRKKKEERIKKAEGKIIPDKTRKIRRNI